MNKTITIAQCTEYSIRAFGGTEVLAGALVRKLSRDFRIVLVSNDDTKAIAASEFAPLIAAHIPWQSGKSSAPELARRLRSEHVDLAHFHFGGNYGWSNRALNRSPLLAVNRAGIPCVTTNHGVFALLDGYCASWRPLWMKLALLPPAWISKMHVLAHTAREVAVSRHDLRNLQRWYCPFRKTFCQIYHSRLESGDRASTVGAREKRILCVGSIGFRKGQAVLAKAFAAIANSYPDWTLVLAGRPNESSLVKEIESIRSRHNLENRLQLVGALDDSGITRLMRTSEIFVMPSLHEGLGLALQEALFHGCACIGSRVGGIPELIDHEENGLLVRAGDVGELAVALGCSLDNPDLRSRFRKRGPVSIIERQMTSKQMTQRYTEVYREILGR